jgi:hypothetical protein
MNPELQLITYHANAIQNSFVILAKCLINNGALKPSQFPAALKATFNEPDADFDRPDYQFFLRLAKLLEDGESNDRL